MEKPFAGKNHGRKANFIDLIDGVVTSIFNIQTIAVNLYSTFMHSDKERKNKNKNILYPSMRLLHLSQSRE